MKISEFLAGAWTWHQLLAELGPLVLACVACFFAGYEYGQRQRLRRIEDRIDRLERDHVDHFSD